jgi:CheY-like chemotaxis protein
MTEFIKLANDSIVVQSCESVEEALDFLSMVDKEFPDVIYVDLNMPILDGFDFIESFENFFGDHHSTCSLFMLTSSLREDDRDRAMAYQSVKDFVSKNDIDEFLHATLRKNAV